MLGWRVGGRGFEEHTQTNEHTHTHQKQNPMHNHHPTPLGTPSFGPGLRKFTSRLREMSMWFWGQNPIPPKQRAQQARPAAASYAHYNL